MAQTLLVSQSFVGVRAPALSCSQALGAGLSGCLPAAGLLPEGSGRSVLGGSLVQARLEFPCCDLWLNDLELAGLPGWPSGEEPAYSAGAVGLIRGSEGTSGGGHGDPLQCSCLGNPMGWEAGGLLVSCGP